MHSCQLLGFGVLTVEETSKVTSIRTKGFAAKFNNELFGRREKRILGQKTISSDRETVYSSGRRKSLQHSTFGMNFSPVEMSKWVNTIPIKLYHERMKK